MLLHGSCILLRRGCIRLHWGCSLLRRGSILLHRGCILLHGGCILLKIWHLSLCSLPWACVPPAMVLLPRAAAPRCWRCCLALPLLAAAWAIWHEHGCTEHYGGCLQRLFTSCGRTTVATTTTIHTIERIIRTHAACCLGNARRAERL